MKSVKSNIEKLCEWEQRLQQEKAAMPFIECASHDIDKEYKKLVADITKTAKPKETERYQAFIKKVEDLQYVATQTQAGPSQLNQTVNVDGMIVEESSRPVDPITKNFIEDPVRNRFCNHLYDRNSITAAIAMNQRVRCPYIGCRNKKQVTLADIVEDRECNRHLMQERQESMMEID